MNCILDKKITDTWKYIEAKYVKHRKNIYERSTYGI